MRVSWAVVEHPDLAGYVVFRASPNPTTGWVQITSDTELITDTFFLDTGAVGFYSFWYMVIAVDEPGNILQQSDPKCTIHYCHGDADLSGVVDVSDVVTMQRFILGMEELDYQQRRAADANLDGVVDVSDVVQTQRFIIELDAQEAHCLVAQ